MNDLLFSVKSKRRGGDDEDNDLYEGMEEGFSPPPTEQELAMQTFFKAVESIKMDMAEIKSMQKEIVSLHEKGKVLVKTKEIQKHQDDIKDRITHVSKLANQVKAKVEALDKDNEAAKKIKSQAEGTASERTRTTITAGLKKKLKDLMAEFSELRTRMNEEYREVVERRIYTVSGEKLSEEQIDKIIESGEAENVFKKAILDQGRGRVLDTLAEIQERHRAVKDLEQSLLELHQIFLDMAVLVEAQGEMLDNIEKQVARSVEYVASGTEAIQQAKQLQKKTRKMMCCAFIVLIVIALIIVLAVVQPWKFVR